MSLANLIFFHIFIHMSHPLYICKHNLQAAMDKGHCGLIDVRHNPAKVQVAYVSIRPTG